MTKDKVERNLPISPYTIDINYGDRHFIYCFSSETIMDKFRLKLYKNREEINESLTNRFKMTFAVSNELCDVTLYRKCESRGFCIKIDGSVVLWPGQLNFDGQKITHKSLKEL